MQNAGQRDYGPCDYKIKDPGLPENLPRQKYVDGTCVFINEGKQQRCNDASLNGGGGLCSPVTLPKRGGVHLYQFRATVGSPAELDAVDISNKGTLTQVGLGPILPFSAPEVVHFSPSVNIEKTVHLGSLITCSNGQELVQGRQRDTITYCFQVTNTGNTYLDNVTVTDPENGMEPITTIPFMAPGDVRVVKFETTMPGLPILTNATVTGEPRLVNRNPIPTYDGGPVTDLDDAGVDPIPYLPGIAIQKYVGRAGSSCNIESMEDETYFSEDTKFEYCYVINNVGDECLVNVTTSDVAPGGIGTQSIPKLCPGDSAVMLTGPTTATKTNVPSTDASVFGTGEFSGSIVSSSDPAAVDIPAFTPKLSMKKYAGPQGSSCNIELMQDETYLAKDTKFEYCYVITNIGNECVVNVELSDEGALGGIGKQSIPKLCPDDTAVMITGPPTKSTTDVPSIDATISGTGEFSDSIVSSSDAAAVDIPDFAPKLSIKKYAGPQGSGCNVEMMQDETYLAEDTKFEYCYVINNIGNECVVNVTLTDHAMGGIGSHSITKICPGENATMINGLPSSTNTSVPSSDATLTGNGEYSGIDVNVKDPVAVEYVEPVVLGTAGIKIAKTVHLDDIATCFSGQELEYGFKDTVVTYCYEVTNTGNVALDVVLTDISVGTSETFPLAVGSSTFVKKVSTITGNLASLGVAVGTPVDGGAVVEDSDPAGVELLPVKPTCV